jgi:hypothetical protein
MRKVRDYDAELKALSDKARLIKARKVEQLGTLVAATGADALDAETLAGVLLDAVESSNAEAKEAWASKGAAFFQRRARKTVGGVGNKRTSDGEERGGAATG